MRIIGVDFSSSYNKKKTGLARATARSGEEGWEAELECVETANPESAVPVVKAWLDQTPALIAIDAPLGWPDAMRTGLRGHKAGSGIKQRANGFVPRAGAPAPKNRVPEGKWTCDEGFFLRETDRRIWRQTNKKPLEIGADRIARTAYGALKFLEDLRTEQGDLPLAWDSKSVSKSDPPISVIEVYPAATLKAHELLPLESYKTGKDPRGARAQIVNGLKQQVEERAWNLEKIEEQRERLLDNDDKLDAVVCVVAALDFLCGAARGPKDCEKVRGEGWIWCS